MGDDGWHGHEQRKGVHASIAGFGHQQRTAHTPCARGSCPKHPCPKGLHGRDCPEVRRKDRLGNRGSSWYAASDVEWNHDCQCTGVSLLAREGDPVSRYVLMKSLL